MKREKVVTSDILVQNNASSRSPALTAELETAGPGSSQIRVPDDAGAACDTLWVPDFETREEFLNRLAANRNRSVELARKIHRGDLSPGLLFDDEFQLRCPSLLREYITNGMGSMAGSAYSQLPELTPENLAVIESAVQKVRAFHAAGQRMSAAEDKAVVKPESKDTEIKDAIRLESQLVAGEVDVASLFDTEGELHGSVTFREWMKPGARIEPNPILPPRVLAVIESAAKRVFAARCGKPHRTVEEESAQEWLEHQKDIAHLEEALARLGSPHQRARYDAGLLDLEDEALPLLEDEIFVPLQPLNLTLHTQIMPEDVIEHVYGKGSRDPELANADGWLVGHAQITDKATAEERDLMRQIQTALPHGQISLWGRRIALEGQEQEDPNWSLRRNRIEVSVLVEGRTVTRSFASPRGDY